MANLSNINNKFLVTTGGNVGIGVTGPVVKLELQDTTHTTMKIRSGNNDNILFLQAIQGQDGRIGTETNNDLGFYTNGTDRLTISNTGNATFAGEVTLSAETQYLNFKKASTADVLASIISETDAGTGGKIRILTKRNGDTAINALTIDDNQNVGIGTATPQKKVHIEGTGGASEMQILVSSASDTVGHTAGIGLRGEGGEADGDFRIKGGIFFERIAGSFGNGKMILAVNSSVSNTSVTVADHALTIDTNKNVGIGTTSPVSVLEVYGGSSGTNDIDRYVRFKASNGEKRFDFYMGGTGNASSLGMYTSDGTTKNVQISAGGTSYLNAGNVGIGTTSPDGKLEVAGGTTLGLRITNAGDSSAYDQTRITYSGYNSGSPEMVFMPLTTPGSGVVNTFFRFRNTNGASQSSNNVANVSIDGSLGVGTTSPLVRLQLERTVSDSTSRTAPVNLIYLTSEHPSVGYTGFGTAITHYSRTYQNSTKTEQSKIAFTQQGDSTSTAGSTIDFYTKTLSTGSAAPEMRMRITYAGIIEGIADISTYTNKQTVFAAYGDTDSGEYGIALNTTGDALEGSITSNLKYSNGASSLLNTARSSAEIKFANTTTTGSKSAIIFTHSPKGTSAQQEAMRINYNGNVGIGLNNPSWQLEVQNTGTVRHAISSTTNDTAGVFFRVFNSGTQVGNGTIRTDNSGDMSFFTGTSGEAERMTIESGGNIIVKKRIIVNSANSSDNGLVLYGGVNDAGIIYSFREANSPGSVFRWYTGGTVVGSVSTTTSATSFNTSSDYRLKENVIKMTGALDRVSQLKPSRFNFIIDPNKTVDGFLAHEVQNIVPEAISGEKDAVDEEGNPDYQGIDQSKLVPLLVGAIQELKAEIDQLKK